jgi:glycosyltransferase involved in cell wall biosynthesis
MTSIAVVSRWTKIKNIDFVVGLAKQNARDKKPVSINVVSDLRSGKDRRPFNGIMRFSKPMANRKLAQFYGRQGVVISPSTFETYGNVAQEALAGGTPALVSSQMGVSETFRKIGLSDWVVDFTSHSKTLKTARRVASVRVPQKVITALHDACSTDKIFSQYAALLSAAQ